VLGIQQKLSATQPNIYVLNAGDFLWHCSTFLCFQQKHPVIIVEPRLALYKRHWGWFKPATPQTTQTAVWVHRNRKFWLVCAWYG